VTNLVRSRYGPRSPGPSRPSASADPPGPTPPGSDSPGFEWLRVTRWSGAILYRAPLQRIKRHPLNFGAPPKRLAPACWTSVSRGPAPTHSGSAGGGPDRRSSANPGPPRPEAPPAAPSAGRRPRNSEPQRHAPGGQPPFGPAIPGPPGAIPSPGGDQPRARRGPSPRGGWNAIPGLGDPPAHGPETQVPSPASRPRRSRGWVGPGLGRRPPTRGSAKGMRLGQRATPDSPGPARASSVSFRPVQGPYSGESVRRVASTANLQTVPRRKRNQLRPAGRWPKSSRHLPPRGCVAVQPSRFAARGGAARPGGRGENPPTTRAGPGPRRFTQVPPNS